MSADEDSIAPGMALQYAPFCSQASGDGVGGLRSLRHYLLREAVGQGTYGTVFRGTCRSTLSAVALKKISRHHLLEGFPKTETREVRILKALRHPNMIYLREVVTSYGEAPTFYAADRAAAAAAASEKASAKAAAAAALAADRGGAAEAEETATVAPGACAPPQLSSRDISRQADEESLLGLGDRLGDVYLVFDYVEYDIAGLLLEKYRFSVQQVKAISYQLLVVLDFLHSRGFVHRDLKTSNLLLTEGNVLKLGDFGLARALPSTVAFESSGAAAPRLSNLVVTLWYRPPELLLGATAYAGKVDMWSVGCILLELLVGRPIFPASRDIEQLEAIVGVFGSPPEDSSLRTLPLWCELEQRLSGRVSRVDAWLRKLGIVDLDLVHLVKRLLEPDPLKRMTAAEAAAARWFVQSPGVNRDDPAAGLPLVSASDSFPAARIGSGGIHEYLAHLQRKGLAPQDSAAAAAAASGGAAPPPPSQPAATAASATTAVVGAAAAAAATAAAAAAAA